MAYDSTRRLHALDGTVPTWRRAHDVSGSACMRHRSRWQTTSGMEDDAWSRTPLRPKPRCGLFDPRLGACADWSSKVVFFDIETPG